MTNKVKEYKQKDFKAGIPPVYPVEEILKINKINFKEFIKKYITEVWISVENYRKNLIKKLIDIETNDKKYKISLNTIKIYGNNLLIKSLYFCIPVWYFIAFIKFLTIKDIYILSIKKIRIKIYNHRFSMYKKIHSIEINRGVVIGFIPFILASLIYIIFVLKPFENRSILERHLPLFAYPIQTIKWETLMASEDAQKILLEEDNEIRLYRDHLLVRRKKSINLFGNLRQGDYIWNSENTPISKFSDIFQDLDDFPKKLESTRVPKEDIISNIDDLNEYLQTKASDQTREYFYRLRKISAKENRLNFLIRYGFLTFKSRLKFLSLLYRYRILSLRNKKTTNKVFIDDVETSIKRIQPSQKQTKNLRTLGISFDEKTPYNKNEWGSLAQTQRNKERTSKFVHKFIDLFITRIKKRHSKNRLEYKKKVNKNQKKEKIQKFKFDFIKDEKLRQKLELIANTKTNFFIRYLDTFYNYQRRKRPEESRIYIKPRQMSGYVYPDSTTREVFWFKLREFLFPSEKYTTIKIELPTNLAFTKVYPVNYPQLPNLKNIFVATAVTETPNGKCVNDITLSNNLGTPSGVQESRTAYYGTSRLLGALPISYQGPGILVTENNDIRTVYSVRKTPYFFTQQGNGTPMLNVSLDYFMGDFNKKKDDNPYSLEFNFLKYWLNNYYSPDNPLLPEKIQISKHAILKKMPLQDMSDITESSAEYRSAFLKEVGNYRYRIKQKTFWKKWGIFPYYKEFYANSATRNSNISSTPRSLLIGYNGDDWERRYITEEEVYPIWKKDAYEPFNNIANVTLEKRRALSDLYGYCVNVLPIEQIFWPNSKKPNPNLKFSHSTNLEYSPLTIALLHKIYSSNLNLPTIKSTNIEDIWANTTTQDPFTSKKPNPIRELTAWEPIHKNSWLMISYISFVYFAYMLIRETGRNYSREFLGYLINLLHETGYLPPKLRDEFNILIGVKDPGYRIATTFTKDFSDLVGINSFAGQLIDTIFYLRGLVSNPAIAKNAQTLLLVGPPGTGKTILVHAIANEAKVPVLTLTAQGTQEPDALDRLFREARKLAPCIVFFDEVDNIGRKRDGVLGYEDIHNEDFLKRSINEDLIPEMSTIIGQIEDLNPRLLQNKEEFNMVVNRDVQNYLIKKNETEYYRVGLLLRLLVELDGIESRDGIVIIGATNRVNVLDPALLRAGRFNRHVRVPLPDLKKRQNLLQFYSKPLGCDPTIPWDFLAKLTFGFSAADLATIMNESCLQAISRASLHTIETIEHGIDRLTTTAVFKPRVTKGDHKNEIFFSTLRDAYYQAGKVLVGTFLKYHPPILTTHLYYRENSVRYNQILQTTLVEWLRYANRGELEHRIIGSYAGRAGEFIFLEKYRNILDDDSSISNIGTQDWVVSQALITLLVDKWHIYMPHMALMQEQRPLLEHFNMFLYNEVKEQFLYEFSQTYENIPTGRNLLGIYSEQNPQLKFQSSWLQMKLYQQYLSIEIQKWYSIWMPNPEEWKLNTDWVAPDNTFHQNPSKTDVSFGTKYKDLAFLLRDYQIHSIVMEAFNISFLILTEYRELLDQLVYELVENEILRDFTIHEIFGNFNLDCKKLKEDLINIETEFNKLPPEYKILYPSWGVDSEKPTIRWIDIKEILNSGLNHIQNEASTANEKDEEE